MYRVYELIDPRTGAVFYVGRDKSGKRPDQHVAETRRWLQGRGTYGTNTHKLRVIAKILASGLRPGLHVPIETLDRGAACLAERFLIARYGDALTNKAPGGEGGRAPGFTVSEEARRRISDGLKGRRLPPEQVAKMKGRAAWNKGRPHSAETRAKLRLSHLGQIPTAETLALRGESLRRSWLSEERRRKSLGHTPWNKGLPPSDETRQRISEAGRGRIQSAETKRKRSESLKAAYQEGRKVPARPMLGRKHSEESRRKMSEAIRSAYRAGCKPSRGFLGHKHTDETRRKISETKRGATSG